MIASEALLRDVQDVVHFDEFGELGADGLLYDLCWEGEQGDGSDVFEVCRVGGLLFQQGVDLGMFPVIGEGGGLDGAVDRALEFGDDGGGCSVNYAVKAGV